MPSLGEVAQVLEARRKALGPTQKDMLMRIGMSQQQYQRIESGGRYPSLDLASGAGRHGAGIAAGAQG